MANSLKKKTVWRYSTQPSYHCKSKTRMFHLFNAPPGMWGNQTRTTISKQQ